MEYWEGVLFVLLLGWIGVRSCLRRCLCTSEPGWFLLPQAWLFLRLWLSGWGWRHWRWLLAESGWRWEFWLLWLWLESWWSLTFVGLFFYVQAWPIVVEAWLKLFSSRLLRLFQRSVSWPIARFAVRRRWPTFFALFPLLDAVASGDEEEMEQVIASLSAAFRHLAHKPMQISSLFAFTFAFLTDQSAAFREAIFDGESGLLEDVFASIRARAEAGVRGTEFLGSATLTLLRWNRAMDEDGEALVSLGGLETISSLLSVPARKWHPATLHAFLDQVSLLLSPPSPPHTPLGSAHLRAALLRDAAAHRSLQQLITDLPKSFAEDPLLPPLQILAMDIHQILSNPC